METAHIISSRHNPKIKNIKSLLKKKKERIFLLEGTKLIKEAVQSGYIFHSLVISSAYTEKHRNIISWVEREGLSYFLVTPQVLSFLSDMETPPGILGFVRGKEYGEEVHSDSLFLLLDNLSDPGNLGTLFRLGQGFGVNALYLSANSVSPFSSKVIRASMGAVLQVKFFEHIDIKGKINELKRKGVAIYATTPWSDLPLQKVRFTFPLGLIFGNESRGVSSEIISLADEHFKIPLKNKLNSLNVSMAAGIILFHINQLTYTKGFKGTERPR